MSQSHLCYHYTTRLFVLRTAGGSGADRRVSVLHGSKRAASEFALRLKRSLRAALPGGVGDAADDQGGPAGLVAGTETAAGFTVEIFME